MYALPHHRQISGLMSGGKGRTHHSFRRTGAGSSAHLNGTAGGQPVTPDNARPGMLVVRGPDWKWDDQVPTRRRRIGGNSPF